MDAKCACPYPFRKKRRQDALFMCVSSVRIEALTRAFYVMPLKVPSRVRQRSSQVKLYSFQTLVLVCDSNTQKSWFTDEYRKHMIVSKSYYDDYTGIFHVFEMQIKMNEWI